jgi:hypothetical protein
MPTSSASMRPRPLPVADVGQADRMRGPHPMMSRRDVLAGGLSTIVVLAACGGDDAAPTAVAPGGVEDDDAPEALPINDPEVLKALFDPRFAPLGLHVTRIGLYDLDAGFVLDDDGDHLAIYVEPVEPAAPGWDDERYIEMVAPSMAAATPFALERWSGIHSIDVCQEPPQAAVPDPEPPIVTQVFLDRPDAERIDWDTVELADLLEAKLRSPETARVAAHPRLEEHPSWVAAAEEASSRPAPG